MPEKHDSGEVYHLPVQKTSGGFGYKPLKR